MFKLMDRCVGIPLVWLLGLLVRLCYWKKAPERFLAEGDHVLGVKSSALGDTLLLLPVLKALKQRVGPQGRVTVIATDINEAVLRNNPSVDRLFVMDFGTFIRNPLCFFSFVRQLRAEKTQVALDFDQWLRISPLLCFLSGAPARIGFKTRGQFRHYLYNLCVVNDTEKHESEQFADLACLAGVSQGKIETYSGFLKRETLFSTQLEQPSGAAKKPLVHFHPGCGIHGWQRAWPVEYYVGLALKLNAELGASIRLTGMGQYEEDLAGQIQQLSGIDMDNRCGRLDLAQLTALLEEDDLVVCGNTGIMHLAVGLDRPLVALHGPTNPVKWGPGPASTYALVERNLARPIGQGWEEIKGQKSSNARVLRANLPCSPCLTLGFEYACPLRPCMEGIEVNIVYRECLAALSKYLIESGRIN